MRYSWEDLKKAIGSNAKTIIEQERGTSHNGKMHCVVTEHAKGQVPMVWYEEGLHWFCHDCSSFYDIIDHAQWLSSDDNSEAYKTLHELANIPYEGSEVPKKREKQHIQPVVLEQAEEIQFPTVDPVSKVRTPESIEYLSERGISEHTYNRYGITGIDGGVCFNYVISGKLVKVKVRRIGNIPNGKKKYDLTPKGGSNVLYGQHLYKEQRALLICEGEVDAVSAHEALQQQSMDDYILCSSVPSGSSSFGWIENSRAFIDKFESVIILGDNDKAGREFTDKAIAKLSEFKRVFLCDMSKRKANDVNELLMDYGAKAVAEMLLDTKEHKPSFTVDFATLDDKDTGIGFSESGFFQLDRKLYGLQHGFVTVFTGRSGDGKTTVLRQIIEFNHRLGFRVGAMMGEESAKKFRERFMMQATAVNHAFFEGFTDKWDNKRYRLNEAGIKRFNDQHASKTGLIDNSILVSEDSVAKVFKWMNYEANLLGTKLFIIDNLMKFETGVEAQDVYALQAKVIDKLKTFAEALHVHVIIVAHPRKDNEVVQGDSIAGSKKIYNLADNVIIFQRLDRDINDGVKEALIKRASGKYTYDNMTAYLKVDKNRDSGLIGYIPMRYDEKSNTICDLDPENIDRPGYYTKNARTYTPEV